MVPRLLAAAALVLSVPCLAQPAAPLPGSLAGRWTFVGPGRTIIDAWSIRIDGAGAPGPVAGRLTWRGVTCGAQDEPVTGTWDGAELRFEGTLRPNVNVQNANGQCGSGRVAWVLARKPGTSSFEGTATQADRGTVVTVTAAP